MPTKFMRQFQTIHGWERQKCSKCLYPLMDREGDICDSCEEKMAEEREASKENVSKDTPN